MSKEEINAPLEELDMDKGIKAIFKENCDLVIKAAAEQKGKSNKIKVPFSDGNGQKFTLICESKRKKNIRPTIKDKIRTLDVAQETKKYLENQLKNGNLKYNQVKDIELLSKKDTLVKLDTNAQIKAIKIIIKNKNEALQRNAEEIAIQAIKANIVDSQNVDEWYRAVIRLCKDLCEKLDVNQDEVLKNLDPLNKKKLSEVIVEVIKLVSQLINRL